MTAFVVARSGCVGAVATSASCLSCDDDEPMDVLKVEAVLAVVEAEAKEVRDGMLDPVDLVEIPDSMVLRLFESSFSTML